jgi:hypothetical protein
MQFQYHIDLSQNELRRAVIQNLASAPSNPIEGQFYYDTTSKSIRKYNGTSWDTISDVANSVTSISVSSPITNAGSSTSPLIGIDSATSSVPGSMSAADKSKLDAATFANTGSALVQRDPSGNISANTVTANLTGTASNATQLNNQASDYYLDRVNHTGTQLAVTISDFDTQVRTSRLDQMASPTTDINLSSHKITNLGAPIADGDAANKLYVDSIVSGLDVKQSVRVATTSNINLSAPGSIDGISLNSGDRVLVKDQTTPSENGIYILDTGALVRAGDFNSSLEASPGAFCFVEQGTTNSDTGWIMTADGPITLGTTSLTFSKFSSPGELQAGEGLVRSGNQFNIGQGTGIVVGPDDISIDTSLVSRKYSTLIGDGTVTSIEVTHNLGTRDIVAQIYMAAAPYSMIITDIEHTSLNSITLSFSTAPTAGQYKVVVMG